tara:strand:- start:1421 stop:2296 length:876 start_codon:yes stop_codon:yes gene_type:complete
MSFAEAEQMCVILNNHVRKIFPNLLGLEEHPVELEFEKYFKSLGVGVTKNRNAGLISWKDGKWLDNPEFTVTGFMAKRMSITQLAKSIQNEVLSMWVKQVPEKEVTMYLRKQYNKVLQGDIHFKNLLIRSRFRETRFIYKCGFCDKQYTAKQAVEVRKQFTSNVHCTKCGNDLLLKTLEGKNPSVGAGVEGVMWYNQNNKIQIDDSYVCIKVVDDPTRVNYINPISGVTKRPSYLSASTTKELGNLSENHIDYGHYAQSIIKKALPIYDAMNWDITPISRDLKQRTLNEWW